MTQIFINEKLKYYICASLLKEEQGGYE